MVTSSNWNRKFKRTLTRWTSWLQRKRTAYKGWSASKTRESASSPANFKIKVIANRYRTGKTQKWSREVSALTHQKKSIKARPTNGWKVILTRVLWAKSPGAVAHTAPATVDTRKKRGVSRKTASHCRREITLRIRMGRRGRRTRSTGMKWTSQAIKCCHASNLKGHAPQQARRSTSSFRTITHTRRRTNESHAWAKPPKLSLTKIDHTTRLACTRIDQSLLYLNQASGRVCSLANWRKQQSFSLSGSLTSLITASNGARNSKLNKRSTGADSRAAHSRDRVALAVAAAHTDQQESIGVAAQLAVVARQEWTNTLTRQEATVDPKSAKFGILHSLKSTRGNYLNTEWWCLTKVSSRLQPT